MFGALDTATSGLIAQRIRMDTIAGNIANMHATQRLDGRPGPYQRRVALFASGCPARGRGAPGVHVSRIVEDPSPGRLIWDPNHPHAIQSGERKGYVQMPNVELSTEMINAAVPDTCPGEKNLPPERRPKISGLRLPILTGDKRASSGPMSPK